MRKLPRSLRLVLLAAALAVAFHQPATQAQSPYYQCWEDGQCNVCCDLITDCCTAACPWGDSFWC